MPACLRLLPDRDGLGSVVGSPSDDEAGRRHPYFLGNQAENLPVSLALLGGGRHPNAKAECAFCAGFSKNAVAGSAGRDTHYDAGGTLLLGSRVPSAPPRHQRILGILAKGPRTGPSASGRAGPPPTVDQASSSELPASLAHACWAVILTVLFSLLSFGKIADAAAAVPMLARPMIAAH